MTVDCRQSNIDVIVKNHRVLYERIRGYLFEQYGIETDHTSDIARPCYLCHDADAYYDEPNFHSNPSSRFLKVGTRHAVSDNPQNNSDTNQQTVDKNKNNYENDIEKIFTKCTKKSNKKREVIIFTTKRIFYYNYKVARINCSCYFCFIYSSHKGRRKL